MRISWARGHSVALGFGVSALLVCCRPLSAVENAPAPEMAENVDRLSELGERYLVAGDAAGLAAVKKKLAEMKTDRPAALLALGRLLHSEEKDADAAVTLEEALALRPNDFDTERELGAVYNAVGQYEKASFIMKKALKQRPQGDGLTIELARCYVRMGRLAQAKALFAQAKSMNRKEVAQAYITLGYAYLDAGEYEYARREFETLIAVDTASPYGYHHMGTYSFKQRHFHEAEEYFRQAVQRSESNPLYNSVDLYHALSWLGRAFYAQGRMAEAEAVYRKGLVLTHLDMEWRLVFLGGLGAVAQEQGKVTEVEQLYRQAIAACEPGLGCLLHAAEEAFRLGTLYAASGRMPEAEAVADRIGKLYDGRPINEETIGEILQLGELYKNLGQNVKAEALLRRILKARETMPTHGSMGRAEESLADICARQGRLADAEDMYLKAIEVYRVQGDIARASAALGSLASAYEREGKSQKAAAARSQAEALMAQGGKS